MRIEMAGTVPHSKVKAYVDFVDECEVADSFSSKGQSSDRHSRSCTLYGALLRLELLPSVVETCDDPAFAPLRKIALHILGADMQEGQSPQV